MRVPESLRSTVRAALYLLVVFVVGTMGYTIIGGSDHSLLEAVYMTTITLTTVGYEEAIDLSGRPGAQLFTVVLLLTGVGTFLYFFSSLTAFATEGAMEHLFWRRRMSLDINRLRDHFIVCGAGKTGEHVVRELIETRREFALVDRDEERVREMQKRYGAEFPAVVGDATEDEILKAAGLAHAHGIIVCFSGDKDNILVTFTARNMSPTIRIVARCADSSIEPKLRKAGADAVVSPDRIGGLRLISEMVRPTAVSFLDVMLRDSEKRWRVEEVTVDRGSELDGVTVGALRGRTIRDLVVLAVRATDGEWVYNPDDDVPFRPGTGVVFLGSPDARTTLERATTSPEE
jgi:voltage-gated potassium channel